MTWWLRTHVRTVLAVTIAAAALSAAAVAYWSGTGSGATQTQLANTVALVLSPGTPSMQLFPGDDVSVSLIANNANPYTVRVGSLMLDTSAGTGGFDVDAGHAGCDVSTLRFVTQNNAGAGWTVPPKSGAVNGSLPIDIDDSLTMGADATNACQGAIFTVHLVAGA